MRWLRFWWGWVGGVDSSHQGVQLPEGVRHPIPRVQLL